MHGRRDVPIRACSLKCRLTTSRERQWNTRIANAYGLSSSMFSDHRVTRPSSRPCRLGTPNVSTVSICPTAPQNTLLSLSYILVASVRARACLSETTDYHSKCVRVSRPLVGFWTHFKSLHFHSFMELGTNMCKSDFGEL